MRGDHLTIKASALIYVLVVGAFAATVPLVAIALTVAPFFILGVVLHPRATVLALAFLTAAFPKAGVKVGDFPVPFMLFGLALALLILPRLVARRPHTPAVTLLLVMYLGWVAFRALTLFGRVDLGGLAAFVAWAAVPAIFIYLATRVESLDRGYLRAFEAGFIIAALFALVQQVAGIEETAIPGLTIALGDSYADKHNVIYLAAGQDFSKIMSTYQGGNIFGIVAAVFLVIAASRIIKRSATAMDFLLFAAGAWSVGLSGSRTGIVAAIVGLVVLFMGSGIVARKGLVVAAGVAGGALVLLISPGLAQRYTIDSVISSGGAGRTDIWLAAIERSSWNDWAFGADQIEALEGAPGIVLQLGLVGTIALVALAYQTTRRRRGWLAPFAALAAAISIDYSYALFPTLFIPAALVAANLVSDVRQTAPDEPVEVASTARTPARSRR